MTVSTKAKVQVGTEDLRNAFRATFPLAGKVITGDNEAQFRVRLIFDGGWIFACASNGSTTGLAKVQILEDSRGAFGQLEADDGPMIVDLQPRRVQNFLQQFKGKGNADVDQLIEVDIDLENKLVKCSDIGGLWSDGEFVGWPIEEPSASFPDVLGITGRAVNGMNASPVGKPLVADAKLLAQFRAAGRVYDQPVQLDPTGTPDSRGFVALVGSRFVGTIESRHHDDDSLGKRDRWRNAWRELLPQPTKTLAAV